MNIYLEAFGIFFKIGAFTIGGGYAMVPLIENEIVTKRKWIAQEDFIDLLAISQSAPGILAVNISIFSLHASRLARKPKCSHFWVMMASSLSVYFVLFHLAAAKEAVSSAVVSQDRRFRRGYSLLITLI